ncbi:MAG: sialidase family protein [Thermoplasmatota archaeon]
MAGRSWNALVAGLVLAAAFAGCSNDQAPTQTAVYGCVLCPPVVIDSGDHSHFENILAVSPIDADHWAVASMYTAGTGPQTVEVYSSWDAGATWTGATLPYGDRVPVDHPLRSVTVLADPSLVIAPDDTTLVFVGVGLTSAGAAGTYAPTFNTLFSARSTDGGRTFPADGVRILSQSYVPLQDFSDYPKTAMGHDGRILAMWGNADIPGSGGLERFLASQGDSNQAGNIEVRFSVSDDAGDSWTPPAFVYDSTHTVYYSPVPAILGDGSWVVMPSEELVLAPGGPVYVSRSTDEGRTWSWHETPMIAIGFGAAVGGPGSRMYYTYYEGATDFAFPTVAWADSEEGPWTLRRLSDVPTERSAIYPSAAVDGRGVLHALYTWRPEGSDHSETRMAQFTPDGERLADVVLEQNDRGERTFGHHFGVAALPDGAAATWNGNGAPWDLVAGAVRASPR